MHVPSAAAGYDRATRGIAVFLLGDAFTFASLLFGYVFLRLTSQGWAAALPGASLGIAVVLSALLLAGSVAMLKAARGERSHWLLALTTALGAMFLALTAYEWNMVAGTALSPRFSEAFYLITGFHALHVAAALPLLAMAWARPRFAPAAALYWHFVDAAWLAIVAVLYLGNWR